MDVRLTWTDCDESGDCVVPNALSPRDLVSRPDNMDETVLHTPSLINLPGKPSKPVLLLKLNFFNSLKTNLIL